jgi:hypothetical protein
LHKNAIAGLGGEAANALPAIPSCTSPDCFRIDYRIKSALASGTDIIVFSKSLPVKLERTIPLSCYTTFRVNYCCMFYHEIVRGRLF